MSAVLQVAAVFVVATLGSAFVAYLVKRSRQLGYELGERDGAFGVLDSVTKLLEGDGPAALTLLTPQPRARAVFAELCWRVESLRFGLGEALARCHVAKDEMQAVRNALEGGPVPEADPVQVDSGWALAQRVAELVNDRNHVYRCYVDQFTRRVAVAGVLEHLVELVRDWPGDRVALVTEVYRLHAGFKADQERKPRLAVPNPCTVCQLPIELGSFIGAGDGSMKDGEQFAHLACYWRREAGAA